MKIVNKSQAIKILKDGFPLGFQTDTLPAIGCLPEFAETIYGFKKRDKNKPLILMGADISQFMCYVNKSAINDFLYMAEQYWPGPLTLVIPLSEEKKSISLTKLNTLGLRIPNSNNAKSLIFETGPLATSSANISGKSTSFTANEVNRDLPYLDLLGPIPWEKCSGKGSTIISFVNEGKWELIRQGEISITNFEQ